MASKYLLQIISRDSGDVIQFEPGLSTEINFIDDIVTRTIAKGVGLFKSKTHVETDLRTAIGEALYELKSKIRA